MVRAWAGGRMRWEGRGRSRTFSALLLRSLSMSEFVRRLFESSFKPHGHRYPWRPETLWLHAVSDALIALLSIVRKRRDLAFPWVFVVFGAFLLLCGTTHVLEISSIWHGAYRLTGVVKAVMLVTLVPRVLTLVGPGELRDANSALRGQTVSPEEPRYRALVSATLPDCPACIPI